MEFPRAENTVDLVDNIIAKFPGKKDGIIVLAGHYDTNLPLKNTAFVGANGGPRNRIQIRIEGD
jgi:hypothetical protein